MAARRQATHSSSGREIGDGTGVAAMDVFAHGVTHGTRWCALRVTANVRNQFRHPSNCPGESEAPGGSCAGQDGNDSRGTRGDLACESARSPVLESSVRSGHLQGGAIMRAEQVTAPVAYHGEGHTASCDGLHILRHWVSKIRATWCSTNSAGRG